MNRKAFNNKLLGAFCLKSFAHSRTLGGILIRSLNPNPSQNPEPFYEKAGLPRPDRPKVQGSSVATGADHPQGVLGLLALS